MADHARSNSLYSDTPAALSTAAWQRSSEPTRRHSRTWRKASMCPTCTLAAPPTVQGCNREMSSQVRRWARAGHHRSPRKPLRCNNLRRKRLRASVCAVAATAPVHMPSEPCRVPQHAWAWRRSLALVAGTKGKTLALERWLSQSDTELGRQRWLCGQGDLNLFAGFPGQPLSAKGLTQALAQSMDGKPLPLSVTHADGRRATVRVAATDAMQPRQ